MNIYYHPLYTYGIDSKSSFPRERYELIRNNLESEFKNGLINFVEPSKAEVRDIYLAHGKDYVDRFLNSNLSKKEIREIGLKPWSSNIIERTMLLTGGSLSALKDIFLGAAVSANLAGGTHHAHKNRGSGFCIFNDLAICALKAINLYNFKNVLIIDLDVHQGDGTASILNGIDEIFTFSMHCQKNFPFKKSKSNFDIELKENTEDSEYLFILENSLEKLKNVSSDIIFFQGGVDTHHLDRYGKLLLSSQGLKKRNELILNFVKFKNNPIVIFMGGGYSKPINHTVEAFKEMFIFFAKNFS
tara:strand:+ start:235 stop:1137 length:903 start_codon:yes stop_codon:yes gene_type:complete